MNITSKTYRPVHGGRSKENKRHIFWIKSMKPEPLTPEQIQRRDEWRARSQNDPSNCLLPDKRRRELLVERPQGSPDKSKH